MDDPKTVTDAEIFIQYLPPFGIFLITDLHDAIKKENVVFDKNRVADIAFYLIGAGFARWRLDAGDRNNTFFEFTDEGRKLQKLKTVEAYNAHLLQEAEERDRRKQRDKNLYWINFWIAVGALAAAAYYILEILRIQYHLGLPCHVYFR
jgi:hypothetical protein